MQKIDFLKFYVINTSDNLPFQPYFCNPHVISFQKMYILSVVQFMPKKMSATGLCTQWGKGYMTSISIGKDHGPFESF